MRCIIALSTFASPVFLKKNTSASPVLLKKPPLHRVIQQAGKHFALL
jgi:hypothetical protein